MSGGAGWEQSMFAVFDDLEQQADGLHRTERDAEVAELTVAEYARVGLGSRVHASLGRDLRVGLEGGQTVSGRVARVGQDWLLLVSGGVEWVLTLHGVVTIEGLSTRADSEETWSVADRLSLRSVLRRISASGEPCTVHLRGDRQVEGRLGRIGRDFVELGVGADRAVQVVPTAALVALRRRNG
jgi:hypothetical protein